MWSGATFSCRPAGNLLLTLTYSQMHPVPWDLLIGKASGFLVNGSSSTTDQGFDCLARVICHCACWGGAWSHNKILFHCDNLAVVEVWEKQSMRDKALMQLV